MRVTTIVACLVLSSSSILVATPASADPPPACGSTLTVDTVLRADLVCAGPGLLLAPGVDLNLKGHTVKGTAGGVGVSVASAGDATVKNGTLTGWDTALGVYAATDMGHGPLHVEKVSFRDNGTGLNASDPDNGTLHTKDVTITGSTFTGSREFALVSAFLPEFDISSTTFMDNRTALSGGTSTLTNTRFVRNGVAISVAESRATVVRSTFIDNPVAVDASWFSFGELAITDSTFTGSDVAVRSETVHADISGSMFVGNTTAVTIGIAGATVVGNTFRANGTTLRLVEEEFSPTLVQDNTFRLNGDGLVLAVTSGSVVSVGGNDARRNTGWGINVSGVSDLGGNTARGNGNEPQCVGVVCTP
ncbi:right-handed parallel beta-helix repeat-containing protein [Cellulomonas sp. URHE0023]|uniref:right-handed parallel beta-helix repeat-containing protein n=1 Tax=Cellulomonas sp. URHE0023 TaxID=1380354 RepID=UPI00048315CB|nr:right-handed parallel beta-helix repeat-containing protein [Cellulomonas sp. URHE0023]